MRETRRFALHSNTEKLQVQYERAIDKDTRGYLWPYCTLSEK